MSKFQQGHLRSAKKTPEEIMDIRAKYAEGWSQGRLARYSGLSVGQIGRIVRNESWQQFPAVPTDQQISTQSVQNTAGIAQEDITASELALLAKLNNPDLEPAPAAEDPLEEIMRRRSQPMENTNVPTSVSTEQAGSQDPTANGTAGNTQE